MDAINTIKVTVEPTKADSVVKPESTVVNGDPDTSVEELENKSSFSDTLKDNMENDSDSQKNNSSAQSDNKASGNNLPNETESSVTVKETLSELLEVYVSDEMTLSDKSTIPEALVNAFDTLDNEVMPEDLINAIHNLENKVEAESLLNDSDNKAIPEALLNAFDNLENKSMPEGLVNAFNKANPENLLSTFDNKTLSEDAVNSSEHQEKNKTLNSIQSLFKQITYGQNQFETLNEKNDSGNAASEMIKSMMKNTQNNLLQTKGNNTGLSNENSLFQGSSAQLGVANQSPGNMMSGLDLSANSDQNSSLSQQFSELKTRLLNQDKVLEENRFDITKLTQPALDTQKSSIINEINPARSSVSELMIKTPVMDKQWNTEFTNHIAFISKSGGGNASIKLNPAHLGPIEANIKIVNDVATIQIAAAHITTRDAMDAAIPRLKEMLEEQGFSQVNVDISEKGFSHHSSKESAKSEDGTSSANGELVDEEEGDFSNDESMTVLEKSVSNGVVDYFA